MGIPSQWSVYEWVHDGLFKESKQEALSRCLRSPTSRGERTQSPGVESSMWWGQSQGPCGSIASWVLHRQEKGLSRFQRKVVAARNAGARGEKRGGGGGGGGGSCGGDEGPQNM